MLPRHIGGTLYGIHGEIECKTGGATQTKGQKAHMKLVRNSGGIYLIVRSRAEVRPAVERALGLSDHPG